MNITNAKDAIARSISHNEIVHLAWSRSVAEAIEKMADESIDNDSVVEFWGEDEEGNGWAIHLTVTAESLRGALKDYHLNATTIRSATCIDWNGEVEKFSSPIAALDEIRLNGGLA